MVKATTLPELPPKTRYTLAEAANILGYKKRNIYNLINKGFLHSIVLPTGHQRIEGKEITRFYNTHY